LIEKVNWREKFGYGEDSGKLREGGINEMKPCCNE